MTVSAFNLSELKPETFQLEVSHDPVLTVRIVTVILTVLVWACSKAASRSMPKETATVKFCVLALSGLTAAASWWNGFHSVESRYQFSRVA